MLIRKYLIDFTINWTKALKASPWYLLTLVLLSIPIAALLNFYFIKQSALSHAIASDDFWGDVKQVAIVGDGNKYSAIEPFITDAISANLNYSILYEKPGLVSAGQATNKQQATRVNFVSSEFSKLSWKPYLGSFDNLFTGSSADNNSIAVSYQYWQRELQSDPQIIGSSLYIKEKAAEIVAVKICRSLKNRLH